MRTVGCIDMAAIRGIFERAGTSVDRYPNRDFEGSKMAEAHEAYVDVQAAKTFVNAAAIRAVDRTFAMSGGAGYMSNHPVSRLYRDVRAGPLNATARRLNDAQEYIGK